MVELHPYAEYAGIILAKEAVTVDTTAVLKEAWAAVEEANLPETIREVAFREAVRLISPPTNTQVQPAAAGRPSQSSRSTTGGAPSPSSPAGGQTPSEKTIVISEHELVQKVASGTGAEAESLANLVYLDDGVLRLNLPGIKLGRNNADRTRTIAAVFTVMRSFGLDEDDTTVDLVREEAQRLKCYDSANFSSQLKALPGFVVKGTGNNRRIQAKGPGIKDFPDLVTRLMGES